MGSSHGTKLLGTRREFAQHGQSGAWVCESFSAHGRRLSMISRWCMSCQATLFNHAPAKLFMNTGSGQFGRPSMGAWVTYGIGSESQDLPGFVVLQSGPRGPRGGAVNWGSGFLPTTYQGVPLRGRGDPILDLDIPQGSRAAKQRQTHRRDSGFESEAAGRNGRSGDHHAHLGIRNGLSDANRARRS